jgi:hypothetical protein
MATRDWRVPTKDELNVLFNNRAEIGRFNVTGAPSGWYWSSTRCFIFLWDAWDQRFNDGYQTYDNKDVPSSLRCVR